MCVEVKCKITTSILETMVDVLVMVIDLHLLPSKSLQKTERSFNRLMTGQQYILLGVQENVNKQNF